MFSEVTVHCIVSPHIISGRSVTSIIASVTDILLRQFVIQKMSVMFFFFSQVNATVTLLLSQNHKVLTHNIMNLRICSQEKWKIRNSVESSCLFSSKMFGWENIFCLQITISTAINVFSHIYHKKCFGV